MAVHFLRAGPTLGRTQHDHRPARPLGTATVARLLLNRADLSDTVFERGGHFLVHSLRLVALDEIRLVSVTRQQRLQFLARNAGEDGRIGNLVAIQMEHRQHGAVADRIEEFVRMP